MNRTILDPEWFDIFIFIAVNRYSAMLIPACPGAVHDLASSKDLSQIIGHFVTEKSECVCCMRSFFVQVYTQTLDASMGIPEGLHVFRHTTAIWYVYGNTCYLMNFCRKINFNLVRHIDVFKISALVLE